MIVGQRIRLRAIERDDLSRFVTWLNDSEVTRGLMIRLPLSTADEEAWYEQMLKSPQSEHTMAIDVHEGERWVHLGSCGFHAIDWTVRSGEVGIFIGEKSYWNHGYGSEAMQLLLRHGFQTLNLNRIFLRVYADNARAIRSYEKCGFIREGVMRQAMYKDGQYIDVLFMSVLRSEWKES